MSLSCVNSLETRLEVAMEVLFGRAFEPRRSCIVRGSTTGNKTPHSGATFPNNMLEFCMLSGVLDRLLSTLVPNLPVQDDRIPLR